MPRIPIRDLTCKCGRKYSVILHDWMYAGKFWVVHIENEDGKAIDKPTLYDRDGGDVPIDYQRMIIHPSHRVPEDQDGLKQMFSPLLRLTRCAECMENLDSEKRSAKGNLKSGPCFIATACYGEPNASEVLVLRKFRDQMLLGYTAGRWFVAFYYWISPPIANFLAKHDRLATYIRDALLEPIVERIKKNLK